MQEVKRDRSLYKNPLLGGVGVGLEKNKRINIIIKIPSLEWQGWVF
jgi:hypothetical protein